MTRPVLTKAQRKAVYVVWQRWHENNGSRPGLTGCYRDFRREVKSTIGMDDAVVVKVPGLWLAIEADGYTHS